MTKINAMKSIIIVVISLIINTLIALAIHQSLNEIKEEKWEQFLECSKEQGDAGCDSCYFLIYGYHINPYTGEKIK